MAIFENLFYTDYEPKLQNRFVFDIDGIPAYIVKSANRPNVSSTRKEIDYINTKRYIAGKYAWETLDIVFQDPIVPSGAQKVNEWVRQHMEFTTGTAGYATNYKKDITLNLLGPDGTKVEEWKLKGTFIQSVNFGTLDYASDDLTDITVTLSYDYAILNF
jgi:hypothetical protein